MNCSTPGLPVHHQLPELTQTHVHWVGDAIQPSFPASGSFQMSQLFASCGQSIGFSASASVFPMNIQDWFPLGWTGWISLQSKGLSRVFSNTTVQEHQFFSAQPSLESNSHIHTTTGKTIALTRRTFVGKGMSLQSQNERMILVHSQGKPFDIVIKVYAQPLMPKKLKLNSSMKTTQPSWMFYKNFYN